MWQFKVGDRVKTNYNGNSVHASGRPNGEEFVLKDQYGLTWDGHRSWWDENHRYYWQEDWLLLAEPTPKLKSGFAKFIKRIEDKDGKR